MNSYPAYMLPENVLKKVEGGSLFFPYSLHDEHHPLLLFVDYMSEYWFVDPHYFPDPDDARRMPTIFPRHNPRFELLEKKVTGLKVATSHQLPHPGNPTRSQKSMEPRTLAETYLDRETGRTLMINRVRAHPYDVFRRFGHLSVLFLQCHPHRCNGDPHCGAQWLSTGDDPDKQPTGLFLEALERLHNPGLIVTDGAHYTDCQDAYGELRRNFEDAAIDRQTAFREAKAFTDPIGRFFQCVGYALDSDSGATLIWEVTTPPSTS